MEFLQEWGYIGLFLGSFMAATIIPFSSDALLVAMLAVGGNPVGCLLTATTGNWLGGLSSYLLGYIGKWEWLEKWFKITQDKLERQQARIARYGAWLAFFAWLPLVGDVFAIALGFYRIKPIKCAIFMLIGKFLRFLFWTILFFYTKQWFGWAI
ncbi:MAG: DedA family protein [Prevotellaceae bacterium]|jgi:membrane protein YqaA with SNARE-associated domain|nr:DedA family protein [Prevotellaceae bacterium]